MSSALLSGPRPAACRTFHTLSLTPRTPPGGNLSASFLHPPSSCLISEGVAEVWSSPQSACFSSGLMRGDSGRGPWAPGAPPLHEQRLYSLMFPRTIITQSVVFPISEVEGKSVGVWLCVRCLDQLSEEQDVSCLVEIM